MKLEDIEVGQVWFAGGEHRLVTSIHTPYLVDCTPKKVLQATDVRFNDGTEASAATVLQSYERRGRLACPRCGSAEAWRQYGTAGGIECGCGYRRSKKLDGKSDEVNVVPYGYDAVCIRCGAPHNGAGVVCDACDGYSSRTLRTMRAKRQLQQGELVTGEDVYPVHDVKYTHAREPRDPLSMSTSDSSMARTYCATFSADAHDLGPRFHEPRCRCSFCADRLPHGEKRDCDCDPCVAGRKARGECGCGECKTGRPCRHGASYHLPKPSGDILSPPMYSRADDPLDPPPTLSGKFKDEGDCGHPWHDAIPNGRATRCPWCLEQEPGVDRSLTATPRPGQIWCDKLHNDREHEIIDEDIARGARGAFELKAYGYPPVWVSGTSLLDGDVWYFLRGPTHAETNDELRERIIRRELDRRPEGMSELPWRRIVHGTVEQALAESHSGPHVAAHALKFVRHALELYYGVADINENEDR